MSKIDAKVVLGRMAELPGWTYEAEAIRRQFVFAGFADAVTFVVRLGFVAEGADHHPDLLISYKRVTVTYSTHSDGGVTEKDFTGAAAAANIARSLGASGA
jgi:4a-hydroxytetrahydrobiopterin dehydratase